MQKTANPWTFYCFIWPILCLDSNTKCTGKSFGNKQIKKKNLKEDIYF